MAPAEARATYRRASCEMKAARAAFALARTRAEANAARARYDAAFGVAWEVWPFLPLAATHRSSH